LVFAGRVLAIAGLIVYDLARFGWQLTAILTAVPILVGV
jgi:hypothetical protein